MLKMYKCLTYRDGYEAHLASANGKEIIGKVAVPQEIAASQKEWDGRTFKAVLPHGDMVRVKLVGDDYGLFTSGTGDMVVRFVRNVK